ncbi:SLBB domain-containing protein [Endozoicomonas euniceicola]|uniref:SLBB domain-containing protein n=1 Tax=Endozoicomonas euniceicola TaxID=1234143 RepID=A0ABY6GRS3_9GAMM|nr:SLBB domain-containing protein [Endozoicomonas euniceicola]UYM14788.1 SLBB domain-containing protein [Endozoicomonas euniceicola]
MKFISLISLLFMLLTPGLSWSNTVKPGSSIVLFNDENIPILPMTSVNKHGILMLGERSIDLTGIELTSVSDTLKRTIGEVYSINSAVLYNDNELARVTILGDIQQPGSYLQPKLSPVWQLNYFNTLYDRKLFKADITVIRGNSERRLTEKSLKDVEVMDGDIYLLSLRKIPKAQKTAESKLSESESSTEAHTKKGTEPLSSEKNRGMTEDFTQKPMDMANQLRQLIASQNKASEKNSQKPVSEKKDRAISGIDQSRSHIIQPGDIVTVNLPGEEGFNSDFLIGRDGTLSLPEVGQISLGGMPLDEAEKHIYQALSSVYLGLDKLSVLVKERRLLVTVLGFVQTPGQVEMPDTGNIQTAITLAGGLKDGAQLNKMQLQRGDKIIEFNFKKYLDTGDPVKIPTLQSLDTIFVPSSPDLSSVYGQTAKEGGTGIDPTEDRTAIRVFGEVYRSGSFAFVEGMTIIDALLRAGGVTRYASVEQIRMIDENEPILFNLKSYLDVGDFGQLPVLKEGATVFVPKQVDAVNGGGRTVYVMGQVQKPGAFETGEKVSFLDVLANAGGPNRYADNSMVRILRADGNVVRFNLQEYAEGGDTKLPRVLPGDAIFIPQKSTLVDDSWLKIPTNTSVRMIGAVQKPGRYLWSEGINFMDMLSHAGGPTEKADIAHVRIVSTGDNGKAISREFNLQHFIERGGNWNSLPKLSGGVTVIFPELPEDPSDNKSQWIRLSSEQAIYIMGAVVTPGRYAFSDEMGVLDILSAAQGPTEESDLTNIRIIHRNGLAPRVSRLNLVEYFETGDETLLPHVVNGDSIFIPSRNRSWVQKKSYETIRVLGSVKETGRYDFSSDMTILDILAQAGGPTNTALVEKIIIVNSVADKNQAYTFNLVEFMKDPDLEKLPVLRAGDTIFIPDVKNTKWAYFMDIVRDTLTMVSVVSMTKAIFDTSSSITK